MVHVSGLYSQGIRFYTERRINAAMTLRMLRISTQANIRRLISYCNPRSVLYTRCQAAPLQRIPSAAGGQPHPGRALAGPPAPPTGCCAGGRLADPVQPARTPKTNSCGFGTVAKFQLLCQMCHVCKGQHTMEGCTIRKSVPVFIWRQVLD